MTHLHRIHLTLRPKSEDGVAIDAILVTLSIEASSLEAGADLVSLMTEDCNTPCQDYNSNTISATDNNGDIPLRKYICTSSGDQKWAVARSTVGNISVQALAIPRVLDQNSDAGSRIDLRREKDGVQGAGLSFIPLPLWITEGDMDCRIGVEWELSEISGDVRAIWTFGEGPGLIEVTGNLSYYISSSQYMVGRVRSYPEIEHGKDSQFGFYWFGADTPTSITDLAPINQSLFLSMSGMFEKHAEEKEPYRVFVRRSELHMSYGGTAMSRCYVLEYGGDTGALEGDEILFTLSHEIIHNWLLMNKEDDGAGNEWYNEGIANFYGTLLLERFGLVKEADCIKEVNSMMFQYYTNPLRLAAEEDLQKNKWSNFLKVDLPYSRGFTLLLKTECLIRTATEGRASLDQVALELLGKRKLQAVQRKDWILSVAKYLGTELATRTLNEMLNGELVILPDEIGSGRVLVQTGKEAFELGFESNSSVVSSIVSESRAAAADVRVGDEILTQTDPGKLLVDYRLKMDMKVKRGEEVMDVSFWPRSRGKVSCWEIQVVQSSSPSLGSR